ncbi:MAG: hypothetical protein RSB96_02970, partial [Oscillospiraceae bacterium]
MAHLMIVLDGMQNKDYGYCNSLKNKTPTHFINHTPLGMQTDSLSCIMTLLGVDHRHIPKGRSFIEATAIGLPLCKTDLLFRCNAIAVNE